MLVLGRNAGEWLIFDLGDGRTMRVQVQRVVGGHARLTIDAPETVQVWREELWQERQDQRDSRLI